MSSATVSRPVEGGTPTQQKGPRSPLWKRPWVWAVIAIVLIGVIGAGAYVARHRAAAPAPAASGTGGLLQPFTDGGFRFTVNGFSCAEAGAGAGAGAAKHLCSVQIHLQNVSGKAQTLSGSGQHLFDTKGHKYSLDTTTPAAQKAAAPLLQKLAAGASADGELAFDVPSNTQLQRVELHGSSSSDGAVITLG